MQKRRSPGISARATSTTPTVAAYEYIAGLHRRRNAAAELRSLECGCNDPWGCRCGDQRTTRGYAEAAAHLIAHGYTPAPNTPAMREMWRERGEKQHLAGVIAERWEVAA